jgi:hypothetical protein
VQFVFRPQGPQPLSFEQVQNALSHRQMHRLSLFAHPALQLARFFVQSPQGLPAPTQCPLAQVRLGAQLAPARQHGWFFAPHEQTPPAQVSAALQTPF